MARTFFRMLKKSLDHFVEDDGMRMSAALSFYSAFSLAPLLLIAVSIAGAFLGDEAVRGALDGELRREMGPSAALVVQEMVAHARKPSENLLMSAAGLIMLLVGAAAVFGQLQAALDTIWKVATKPVNGLRGFMRTYLLSFSMILVTGFLLLVSMLLTTALQALHQHIWETAGLPAAVMAAGGAILSFVVTAVLFAAIFKILPNSPVQWSHVRAGALFTAALFMVGKMAIAWYLGREAMASGYGSAGSFIVVLLWLYYSSIILLYGAEFTKVHARLQQPPVNDPRNFKAA